MTTEEAIQIIERVIHTESKWPETEETVEALKMAIAALRTQQEREKNEPLTAGFSVVDTKTGEYPDLWDISSHEEWAKDLCYCDMDGFCISEDGSLVLMDECGRCAYPPDGRFKIVPIQQERENSKPLTLNELREMAQRCEGIYVAHVDGSPVFRNQTHCAAVLDISPAFGSAVMHVHAIYGDRLTMWEDEYGKTWIAYRNKPKENCL